MIMMMGVQVVVMVIMMMMLVVFPLYPRRPVGPGVAVEKMDRMKIIKRRLSMSLRSARPVDDSLSELAEQMALDEPSAARDNGEIHEQFHLHTLTHRSTQAPQPMPSHNHKVAERTYFKLCSSHSFM